jgi:hypothetical protein
MPKKSSGKASRARAARPNRPSPRPSAVLPFDSEAVTVPSVASQSVDAPPAAPSYPRRPQSRTYRPPRSGSLIPITDYSYVMADLKRIGILAGAAFVILIGLTFVVH